MIGSILHGPAFWAVLSLLAVLEIAGLFLAFALCRVAARSDRDDSERS